MPQPEFLPILLMTPAAGPPLLLLPARPTSSYRPTTGSAGLASRKLEQSEPTPATRQRIADPTQAIAWTKCCDHEIPRSIGWEFVPATSTLLAADVRAECECEHAELVGVGAQLELMLRPLGQEHQTVQVVLGLRECTSGPDRPTECARRLRSGRKPATIQLDVDIGTARPSSATVSTTFAVRPRNIEQGDIVLETPPSSRAWTIASPSDPPESLAGTRSCARDADECRDIEVQRVDPCAGEEVGSSCRRTVRRRQTLRRQPM